MRKIVTLKLGRIRERVAENHRIPMTWDPALVEEVARRCTEVESGARNVDNILTNTLLPEMARQVLARIAEGRKLTGLHVGVAEDGSLTYS
jgi:type VI secretion system protein VasG